MLVCFVRFAMEDCLDLAIRTEGAAGSVAPTIDVYPAFDRSPSRSLVRTLPPLYRGANSTKRTGTSSKSFCWRCRRYSLRPLMRSACMNQCHAGLFMVMPA